VTAVCVVVRTVDVRVVFAAAVAVGAAVAVEAVTVVPSLRASSITTVPTTVPSFRAHAGTGPDRSRPGPVLPGIEGRGS
jgi:hypothetical protein